MAAYTIVEEHSLLLFVGESVLDLSHQGLGQRDIAREVRASTFVTNVII